MKEILEVLLDHRERAGSIGSQSGLHLKTMQSFSMQGHKRVHHVNFLQPQQRGGNIFHSQSTVKTLESASQLPY